jgi:uncharacterized protein YydD (DUF2326 family)
MIREIFSTLPGFKGIKLQSGLNVLIADRTDVSSDRQTRNRAGKSSLVEIVHFLLGANVEKDSIFKNERLRESIFGVSFDLDGQIVTAQRRGEQPSRIYVDAQSMAGWPVKPETANGDRPFFRNDEWKGLLGQKWFNLMDDETLYRPSFRSIISYFVRRESASGFLEPVRYSEDQSKADQQVTLSYLLGLDWTVAQKLEEIRRQEKTLAELRKAAKEGAIGSIIPKASELQSQLVLAERDAERVRKTLDSFEVLPEYRELEKEASKLTRGINELSDANTLDDQLIDSMEVALRDEPPPSEDMVERVYKEAGLVLGKSVQERLEDVRAFHRSVVSNRRSYLQAEIAAARERVRKREQDKGAADQRRAEIMRLLNSKGALDQFQQLQREQSRLDATVESLRHRYRAAQQLEGSKIELDIERRQLESRLRLNLEEQNSRVEAAIKVFEEISESLYEDAGNLVLTPTANGLDIEIKIQGQRSKGIQNMQIFCFDMMLMQLASERHFGPGFLIHDSHLFDGVDERQVAGALAIGQKTASKCGWQYIVTMNSDAIPKSLPDGFDLVSAILPVRLTDAREDGGLFGTRF